MKVPQQMPHRSNAALGHADIASDQGLHTPPTFSSTLALSAEYVGCFHPLSVTKAAQVELRSGRE